MCPLLRPRLGLLLLLLQRLQLFCRRGFSMFHVLPFRLLGPHQRQRPLAVAGDVLGHAASKARAGRRLQGDTKGQTLGHC